MKKSNSSTLESHFCLLVMSSVAAQILEQFNSAFTAFLNPLTPQAERNALGLFCYLSIINRSSIC